MFCKRIYFLLAVSAILFAKYWIFFPELRVKPYLANALSLKNLLDKGRHDKYRIFAEKGLTEIVKKNYKEAEKTVAYLKEHRYGFLLKSMLLRVGDHKDEKLANSYFEKALPEIKKFADFGAALDQCFYAMIQKELENFETARYYYKKAADQKYPGGEIGYGYMLFTGDGGDQNLKEAKIYLKNLKIYADAGDVYSQYIYALTCFNEDPEFFNIEDAFIYMRKAADQGVTVAQRDLGCTYLDDDYCKKDLDLAKKYLKMACDGGDPFAIYIYGAMLYSGDGVNQNKKEGKALIKKASDLGVVKAQYSMGIICESDDKEIGEEDKVRYYLELAAKNGDFEAKEELGCILYEGLWGTRDDVLAAKYLKEAADNGSIRARFFYGFMLYNGDGGEKDEKTAMKMIKSAAENGSKEAQEFLDTLVHD